MDSNERYMLTKEIEKEVSFHERQVFEGKQKLKALKERWGRKRKRIENEW